MSPLPGSLSSGVDRLVNSVCLMAVIEHAQVLWNDEERSKLLERTGNRKTLLRGVCSVAGKRALGQVNQDQHQWLQMAPVFSHRH